MTVCVNPRACRIFRSGNCRISFCNNEDIEICDSNNEWGRRTNEIIDFCGETDQGGYETPAEPAPWTEVAVRSDQDWRAVLGGTVYELWVHQELSIEENAAEVKRIGREGPIDKRQSDSFEVGNRRLNVEMPGAAFEVTAPLPNGATFQASETETQSIGITASVSLGGTLFEVMTAEIGLSVSAEYSISSSTTVSFVIECEGDQEGVVAWRPLFDYYEGTFQPSGDSGYIWVPLDNEVSRSNFDYRCIG
ncbi:hypothetical protein MMYC01_205174 [Madurella mycetomatis]|uniref:Uncharacterized protein n=1 Tax=Madurella mycetomatis TaxID=100816 RepID=A0A175WB60_9PEZI|nr:hypothetical protein MMYC01_205174 [Madurella mycetomatis]